MDLVTVKHFNLYCEVLGIFGQTDPPFTPEPPMTYAVACRSHRMARSSRFELWTYPIPVGKRSPVLPIWDDNEHAIPLDRDVSFQQKKGLLTKALILRKNLVASAVERSRLLQQNNTLAAEFLQRPEVELVRNRFASKLCVYSRRFFTHLSTQRRHCCAQTAIRTGIAS